MQISGIRLLGESENNKGVVEIEYDGSWRPVCQGKWWGVPEALIACRQLDYQGGWPIAGLLPDVSPSSTIYAGDFDCGFVSEWSGEFCCVCFLPFLHGSAYPIWQNSDCGRNVGLLIICHM